jgi:hypothetical protein
MIFLHKEKKKKKNPQELNTPTPSFFLLSASSQRNFQRNFLTSESYESLYLASPKLQKNTPNAPNSLGSKAPISSKLSKNKIKGRNHKQRAVVYLLATAAKIQECIDNTGSSPPQDFLNPTFLSPFRFPAKDLLTEDDYPLPKSSATVLPPC